MGGLYAEELCLQTHTDKNTPIKQIPTETMNDLYNQLIQFLNIFKTQQFNPQLITENDTTIDILPIPFTYYTQKNYQFIQLETFTQGLAKLISNTPQSKKTETTDNITPKKERLQRQLTQQEATIQKFKHSIDEKKQQGDLLYLHFQPITNLLTDITKILPKKDKQTDITHINQNPLVKHFDPTEKKIILTLTDNENNTHEIPINYRKTVAENANIAYTTSKKLQKKLSRAQDEIEKTKQKIINIENQQKTLQTPQKKPPEKKYWFERFHWCQSCQGNLIIAGKDAKSNDYLVKKYLKEGDRYVHADIHGAPSCIIKQQNLLNQPTPITQETINEACTFAASYSKAWNQYAEAQVYWVLPEQVSKTPQSGEFVPKGAFIIRGKRNYIRSPLELAIGQILIEKKKKTMCAPKTTIAHYTQDYITIKPGSTSKNILAKKIAQIMDIPITEVHPLLPSGKSDITEINGYKNQEKVSQ
jgi:predicted ribosome quality control (RQC) complex YloA/Tae2 family protein